MITMDNILGVVFVIVVGCFVLPMLLILWAKFMWWFIDKVG